MDGTLMLFLSSGRRMLKSSRAIWLSTAMTLGIGIGATVLALTSVDQTLLRPLPYPNDDRLVRLLEDYGPAAPNIAGLISSASYSRLAEALPPSLSALAAYTLSERTVGASDVTRQTVASLTPALLQILGFDADSGHAFAEGDPRSAIISHEFWRGSLRSAPGALGSQIAIDGRPYVVVGVAARDFTIPQVDAAVFVPLELGSSDSATVLLNGFGVLSASSSASQASSECTTVLQRSAPLSPALAAALGSTSTIAVRAVPLQDWLTRGVRSAMLISVVGAACVLILVCVNASSLLLARHISRRGEFALRTALGASPGALARECVFEALWVSLTGSGIGATLCLAAVARPDAWAADTAIGFESVGLAILGGCAGLGLLVSALVGLGPVVMTARSDLTTMLRGSDVNPGVTAALRWSRATQWILLIESAFAMVVVIVAILLSRSFAALLSVDPGYDASQAISARVYVPGSTDSAALNRQALAQRLMARIRQLPGVSAVGLSNMAPFVPTTVQAGFPVPGDFRRPQVSSAPPRMATALRYTVSEGYAEALGLRLRAGRLLNAGDSGAPDVRWVVNEEFARLYLPPNPVGMRFPWMRDEKEADLEIVGIVAPVLKDGLDSEPTPEIYVPLRGPIWGLIILAAKTTGAPSQTVSAIRDIVREIAPDAAVDVAPLSAMVASSVARPRRARNVFLSLATIALLLAGYGLCSAQAYSFAQRQQELALRLALGASPLALIAGEGRRLALSLLSGLMLGALLAYGTSTLLSATLFEVFPGPDPIAWTG